MRRAAVLLGAALALGIAGCGEDAAPERAPSAAATASATATATATPDATAAPAGPCPR